MCGIYLVASSTSSMICTINNTLPITVPGVRVYDSTRHLSSVSSPGAANPPEYPCSDPDLLPDNWSEVEDWSMIWYDGRDTVHVRVNATEEDTDWRGVGFYSRGLWHICNVVVLIVYFL